MAVPPSRAARAREATPGTRRCHRPRASICVAGCHGDHFLRRNGIGGQDQSSWPLRSSRRRAAPRAPTIRPTTPRPGRRGGSACSARRSGGRGPAGRRRPPTRRPSGRPAPRPRWPAPRPSARRDRTTSPRSRRRRAPRRRRSARRRRRRERLDGVVGGGHGRTVRPGPWSRVKRGRGRRRVRRSSRRRRRRTAAGAARAGPRSSRARAAARGGPRAWPPPRPAPRPGRRRSRR